MLQRSKLLHALHTWKAKAIARRQENVALTKRMVELTQSRDAWKEKALASQALIVELQAENRRVTQPAPKEKKRSLPL
jgi:hypothetical protein